MTSSHPMTRTLLIIFLTGIAHAEPLPVPKHGTCPSGYRESGGYWPDASAAIPKQPGKQCPSGWRSEASYYVQMRQRK